MLLCTELCRVELASDNKGLSARSSSCSAASIWICDLKLPGSSSSSLAAQSSSCCSHGSPDSSFMLGTTKLLLSWRRAGRLGMKTVLKSSTASWFLPVAALLSCRWRRVAFCFPFLWELVRDFEELELPVGLRMWSTSVWNCTMPMLVFRLWLSTICWSARCLKLCRMYFCFRISCLSESSRRPSFFATLLP